MNWSKTLHYFQTLGFALLVLFFALAAAAAQPTVEKVEPPNWWANHTINPVRLVVRGANFQNAKVTSANKSLKVSNVRINSRGDYLFFDVGVASDAKVGKYAFTVSTASGAAKVPFEISPTLNSKTNFQGITNDDVIYLIMPDRFADGDASNNRGVDRANPRAWHGGDFRGITQKIPYLKNLGVTAIWLTPWYDNADDAIVCDKPWCPMTSYHGYGAIDYYQAENHFGTFTDLREMIETAHRNGIKVIQDQVANHVGFKHPWAKNPPLDNWFPPFQQNKFNNSVLLSPNASQSEKDNLLKGWFDFSLPDLNQEEPEVARYEIQNALWWIGMTGVDGIRQDTIQYMPRKFIRDWSGAILRQYPRFWMVGEIFEEDSAQTAFFQGGRAGWDGVDTRLPSVFDFKLWRTSQEVFTDKKPLRALRDVLKYDGLYPNINNVTVLANNHDTDRFMSLNGATLEGAMLHQAFILTARGIPQLYYGEELAMTGGHDPANRKDFPGGFAGDAANKFTEAGRTADERRMFDFVRAWIAIRRSSEALKTGETVDLNYAEDVYVFARQSKNETVIVGINRSSAPQTVEFKESDLNLNDRRIVYRPRAASGDGKQQEARDGIVKLTVPPKNIVLYNVLTNSK